MPSIELRSCPFCGGEAEMWGIDTATPYVACESCGVSQPHVRRDAYDAAAAWNRRAERTCHVKYGPTAVFENETGSDWSTQDFASTCSECGGNMNRDPFTGRYPRYCPSCGARVVGVGE